MFITNYIPNIGFVLGLVPPDLLALLQGGVGQAVLVVVAYSVINLVIQSLIQPKFVGDAVGLSVTLTFLSWSSGPSSSDRSERCSLSPQPVRQGAPGGRRPRQPLA